MSFDRARASTRRGARYAWAPMASVCACASMGLSAYGQTFQNDVVTFAGDATLPQLTVESRWFGFQAGRDRDATGFKLDPGGALAYDYSVHLMKDGPLYRLHHGGRFRDQKPDGTVIDGDHIFGRFIHEDTFAVDPTAWSDALPNLGYANQEIPSPLVVQPQFDGDAGQWYSKNYLEPEIVKVGGIYYMYSQVEIRPGETVDTGQTALVQADRIQLHVSFNGSDWFRQSTTTSVITGIANPAVTDFGHQEVIYAPFDPSGLNWWMYVRSFEDGVFQGYSRLRSASPDGFNWAAREPTLGMSNIGNQIGYFHDEAGEVMLVRISFTENDLGRQVPTLEFSRDGLVWTQGDQGAIELPGSQDNNLNQNTYFLGFSTIDGTGQLEEVAPGRFKLLYGASTANGSTAENNDIFHSEIGLGEMFIDLGFSLLQGDANGDGVVDLLDFDILAQNFGQGPGFPDGASGGDFNGDGVVDLLDFDVLAQNFGASTPGVVPTPSTLAGLIALAAAGAARRRRTVHQYLSATPPQPCAGPRC
ncbi:MAG: dockerin type I domain-containing protein [Planctomycetota bacterium]